MRSKISKIAISAGMAAAVLSVSCVLSGCGMIHEDYAPKIEEAIMNSDILSEATFNESEYNDPTDFEMVEMSFEEGEANSSSDYSSLPFSVTATVQNNICKVVLEGTVTRGQSKGSEPYYTSSFGVPNVVEVFTGPTHYSTNDSITDDDKYDYDFAAATISQNGSSWKCEVPIKNSSFGVKNMRMIYDFGAYSLAWGNATLESEVDEDAILGEFVSTDPDNSPFEKIVLSSTVKDNTFKIELVGKEWAGNTIFQGLHAANLFTTFQLTPKDGDWENGLDDYTAVIYLDQIQGAFDGWTTENVGFRGETGVNEFTKQPADSIVVDFRKLPEGAISLDFTLDTPRNTSGWGSVEEISFKDLDFVKQK